MIFSLTNSTANISTNVNSLHSSLLLDFIFISLSLLFLSLLFSSFPESQRPLFLHLPAPATASHSPFFAASPCTLDVGPHSAIDPPCTISGRTHSPVTFSPQTASSSSFTSSNTAHRPRLLRHPHPATTPLELLLLAPPAFPPHLPSTTCAPPSNSSASTHTALSARAAAPPTPRLQRRCITRPASPLPPPPATAAPLHRIPAHHLHPPFERHQSISSSSTRPSSSLALAALQQHSRRSLLLTQMPLPLLPFQSW